MVACGELVVLRFKGGSAANARLLTRRRWTNLASRDFVASQRFAPLATRMISGILVAGVAGTLLEP